MFVCPACGQRYERAGYCAADGTELAASNDSLLGTEIVRYRLARVLGEGGMGRVYLAVHPTIGSRVAIKVLSEECSRNPELIERFFAEAKAVNLIRHENIVSVLDLAVLRDGRPFIIMEFIDGHTLAHYVRGAQASLGGVAQVMGEVLSGLDAAHRIGIIHRDLKPDNVIVTVEGHAKVLDFGIAKLAPGLRADLSPRTKTGALLGTPAYMAPEQISGSGQVDARTDIYAAGVVMYEAVTGAQPFGGETLFDMMRAHLEAAPIPPRQRRPDLPQAMEDVILQALAKRPEERFQSAGAMAQALAHAASGLTAEQWKPLSSRSGARIAFGQQTTDKQGTPDAYRSTAVAPTTEVSRKRRNIAIGLVAVAIVATTITMFALMRSNEPKQVAQAPSIDAAVAVVSPDASVEIADQAPTGPARVAEPPTGPAQAPVAEPSPVTAPSKSAKTAAPSKSSPPSTSPVGTPSKSSPASTSPAKADPTPVVPPNSGVHIGSNVHIGPNVVIGSNPPPPPPTKNTLTKPADYNPKNFDPVAYLPKAEALAQQLIPDAKLTNFEFDPVFPDGHVDLTMEGRDREYNFRSVEKSARPPNLPRNVPVERACVVHVEVGVREVTATIRKTEDCDDKLVRKPRCRFAGVWKQALAAGTPRDVVARIGWLHDEQWFFDVDLEGKGGGVSTFADRCN